MESQRILKDSNTKHKQPSVAITMSSNVGFKKRSIASSCKTFYNDERPY